jgi:mycothiol synthase
MQAGLPAGFSMRPVTLDDVEIVTGLINDVTTAEVGRPWTTVEQTRADLTSPEPEADRDDLLVIDRDGIPAAYLLVYVHRPPEDEVFVLVYTHPRWWGHGLSAALLRHAEERGRSRYEGVPPTTPVPFRVPRFAAVEAAAPLFESVGLSRVRTYWVMRIDLADEVPSPAEIPGITIRPLDPATDLRGAYDALAEAFSDHWGMTFPSYERWHHIEIEGEGSGFDPGLWFVATAGDEIAGVISCRSHTGHDAAVASVNRLGVRRRWRRRTVGLGLLRSAFRELRRRGVPAAELSVDSESLTGANRLYEKAGMHVESSWEIWGKDLFA